MLKKFSRYFIVAMIQVVVLAALIFFAAPYLLDSSATILKFSTIFEKTQFLSFGLRVAMYIGIYFAWPVITQKLIPSPNEIIIKKLNQARLILLAALLSIEGLYWVGQL